MDLMKILEEKEWNSSYVVTLLRTLEKKGFIEMCGTVRHSTQYARQFKWIVSKEEYVASLIWIRESAWSSIPGLPWPLSKNLRGYGSEESSDEAD